MKLNKIIRICALSVALIVGAGYAPHAYANDSSLIARGGGERDRMGGGGGYHGGQEGGYHGASSGYAAHPEADRAMYNAGAAAGSAGAGNAGNVEAPAYVPQPPIIIAPQ